MVNAEDISALNKYLLSPISFPLSEKGLLAANVKFDFDNDGNPIIESKDAMKITNYCLGVIEHF